MSEEAHNELYEAVGELRGTLRGIDEKLDMLIVHVDTQNGRLGRLEAFRAKVAGVGIGLGAGGGAVGGMVGSWIQHFFR